MVKPFKKKQYSGSQNWKPYFFVKQMVQPL